MDYQKAFTAQRRDQAFHGAMRHLYTHYLPLAEITQLCQHVAQILDQQSQQNPEFNNGWGLGEEHFMAILGAVLGRSQALPSARKYLRSLDCSDEEIGSIIWRCLDEAYRRTPEDWHDGWTLPNKATLIYAFNPRWRNRLLHNTANVEPQEKLLRQFKLHPELTDYETDQEKRQEAVGNYIKTLLGAE